MTNINNQNTKDLLDIQVKLWNELLGYLGYLNNADKELVELAFTQMCLAHNTDKRKSGEYYIIHPVAACISLALIKLDPQTLSATLLHDVPEDTNVTLKQINADFGPEIAFLVEGVTKLSNVRYKGEDRYAENLRRMFVAISKDLRVVLIKLADRLHNLQTLHHVSPEKQARIALESLEIYAPIAERLGISKFQAEIEETAFPYLFPDTYQGFVKDSNLEINQRTKFLDKMVLKTKKVLDDSNIKYVDIKGRAKKYYSIFKKIQAKNKSIKDIYDLIALRIIVETVEDCYFTLSLLEQNFEIDIKRIKDYIANPKVNGYQSLHLTVYDKEEEAYFEFQIRTREMNEFAEYGVAAHYIYKNKQRGHKIEEFVASENLKWIKEFVDLGKEKMSPDEYLQNVKLNLFQDRIFVMTPKNDPIDLPKDSSPLDFAYRIHADIGDHAMMAKINGQIARLSDKLTNGDVVEILTDKRQKPNLNWINWVKTRQARQHIRTYLRKLEKLEKAI